MTYDFELWAVLPEMESKQLEEEECADWKEVELSDEEVEKVMNLLLECGGETSEEMVEEKMPKLHEMLQVEAEKVARRMMAMRLFEHRCYEVDADDLFEEDLRSGVFKYVPDEDLDGSMDDEDGYADAEYAWGEWEKTRIEAMGDDECVEYLTKRYGIKLDMSEVEWGYHLPDELAAEAIAKMME